MQQYRDTPIQEQSNTAEHNLMEASCIVDEYQPLRPYDRHDRPVMLAESKWALNYALSNAPDIEFFDVEPL